MKTILLLKEKGESTDPIFPNLPRVTIHEGDATPGCTCDRWGHPRPGCSEPKSQTRVAHSDFSLAKK